MPSTPLTMTCSSPALCQQCDNSIHFPPAEVLPEHPPRVMALSSFLLEVQNTHAWMIAGHRDAGDAHRAGWRECLLAPPPTGRAPPIARCHAICATIPTFSWIQENYGILHDASWCQKSRRCRGLVAVFCPNTLRSQIYPVNIRIRVDNAYKAELYTAWVALSTRGPSNHLPIQMVAPTQQASFMKGRYMYQNLHHCRSFWEAMPEGFVLAADFEKGIQHHHV